MIAVGVNGVDWIMRYNESLVYVFRQGQEPIGKMSSQEEGHRL